MTQEEHERLMEKQMKRHAAALADYHPQTGDRIHTAIDELRGQVKLIWGVHSDTYQALCMAYETACEELEDIKEAKVTGRLSDAEEWRREDDHRRLLEMKATVC